MATFVVAAAAPAAGALLWAERAALTREKASVADKHLSMARQLAATADILISERMRILQQFSGQDGVQASRAGFRQTMQAMDIRHLCLVDPISGAVVAQFDVGGSKSMSSKIAAALIDEAGSKPRLYPARRDAVGRPTLFMSMKRPDGLVAIAAADPAFAADLAQSVVFGERGHAAIVDQTGQALGHPLAEWRKEMRNLGALKPISAVLAGGTGVVEFRSPAANADMIAGYAGAKLSGWGVIVVQPVSELQASAGDFFTTLLVIVAPLTLAFGALGAWWAAGKLAAPIEQVADAARRFGEGDFNARAPDIARGGVAETAELGVRFNAMADAVLAKEGQLRTSLEQALVADRAKTVFLANMSHELRTPLNAVIGFAEVISSQLLGPIRNDRYLEYADDIARSGRHLLALINDVLDISRVEADRIEIEIADVDAAQLTQLAHRQIAPQAKTRGIEVTVDAPDLPTVVQADERRILQILLNLLQNSVRFTPEGGHIQLTATPAGNMLRFVVADTGIGMSVADAELAIEPFAQPNAALDPAERGAGLGLPLARSLALLHGGALSIDSAPGQGCRVTVEIPLIASERVTPSPLEQSPGRTAA